MNFDWTGDELEFKQRVARTLDESDRRELVELENSDPTEIKRIVSLHLRRLAGVGYLELPAQPSSNAQILKLMAAQEELAQASGSLFISVEITAHLFGGLLKGFGYSESMARILDAVHRGDIIASVALTEPAEPEAKDQIRTVGVSDGGHYLVTGRKDFVTNGPIADYVAVVGLVGDKPAVFIVEPELPGVSLGPRLRTLGYNGLVVSSLNLDEVKVPGDRVIGPLEDSGALDFLRHLQDLILTEASVGLMLRTSALAKKHARTHERGGKPVFAHQEVRFKLAEMLTLTQASQLLAYRAGWMYSSSDVEAATLIHCAKVFAAEASERVANLAMQIMAGQGYIWGNVIEQGYREAKYAALAGTTSERARMAIARDLLERCR